MAKNIEEPFVMLTESRARRITGEVNQIQAMMRVHHALMETVETNNEIIRERITELRYIILDEFFPGEVE